MALSSLKLIWIKSFFLSLSPTHKGLGYSCPLCRPATAAGIKLVGVSQLNPMDGYSPNFQDMFTIIGSRAD